MWSNCNPPNWKCITLTLFIHLHKRIVMAGWKSPLDQIVNIRLAICICKQKLQQARTQMSGFGLKWKKMKACSSYVLHVNILIYIFMIFFLREETPTWGPFCHVAKIDANYSVNEQVILIKTIKLVMVIAKHFFEIIAVTQCTTSNGYCQPYSLLRYTPWYMSMILLSFAF